MSLATADTASRATGGLVAADSADTSAREIPPDITSVEYWSGASVGAILWLAFILYAASRSFG
jgi:hypothetical protein